MVKTKVTVAILVLTLALFIPFAIQAKPTPPGGHLNITEVVQVDGRLVITGEDLTFGPGPLRVTLGEFGELTVLASSDIQIVAELPAGIASGDYLLTVANGNGQSQNDEYDLTIGVRTPQRCPDGTFMIGIDETGTIICSQPPCFDANDYAQTVDPDQFIANCISSAECPDAQKTCDQEGTSSNSCVNCIAKGGRSCDDCNEEMTKELECTNVCQEQQCFDAGDYVGDVEGFLTGCAEIADLCDIETCRSFLNLFIDCASCVEGEPETCADCNSQMGTLCRNICDISPIPN